jgi:hypothetical protein
MSPAGRCHDSGGWAPSLYYVEDLNANSHAPHFTRQQCCWHSGLDCEQFEPKALNVLNVLNRIDLNVEKLIDHRAEFVSTAVNVGEHDALYSEHSGHSVAVASTT